MDEIFESLRWKWGALGLWAVDFNVAIRFLQEGVEFKPFKNLNLFEVNSQLNTNYCHKIPNIEPPTLEDYFFQENKPGVFLNWQL
jgi:hypothetical protein